MRVAARTPVQADATARRVLVGGRDLAGERIGRAQPAPGDHQPQVLAGAEQRRRRAQRDVDRDDLARRDGLRIGAGRDGLSRPRQPGIQGAQRNSLPAGADPVAAVAVGPFERDEAVAEPAGAPLLHADEQVRVVAAVQFHPQPGGHRPGQFHVVGHRPGETCCAGTCSECHPARLCGRVGSQHPGVTQMQCAPAGPGQRPFGFLAHRRDGVAVLAYLGRTLRAAGAPSSTPRKKLSCSASASSA